MKALVIGASVIYDVDELLLQLNDISEYQTIVAVDGGVLNAYKANIPFDYAVGDFDSYELRDENEFETVKLNPIKNDTDMYVAVDRLISGNYSSIDIIGATGNRFDHTMANICMLNKFSHKPVNITMIDEINKIKVLCDGEHIIKSKKNSYISFFSINNTSTIILNNVRYELNGYKLTNIDPLCVSNEFLNGKDALVKIKGKILMIIAKKQ